MRDRHAAAALGRPCRIRDEDCDVEMLTNGDLEADDGYDKTIVGVQEGFHISYVIEMSKLGVICMSVFLPGCLMHANPRSGQDTGRRVLSTSKHDRRLQSKDIGR